MTQTENIPEAEDLMAEVQKNEPWNPVYRGRLLDALQQPAVQAALRELLVISDEQLQLVGQSDFTDDAAIKNAVRGQGRARGIVEAVEYLLKLATETEERKDQDVQE